LSYLSSAGLGTLVHSQSHLCLSVCQSWQNLIRTKDRVMVSYRLDVQHGLIQFKIARWSPGSAASYWNFEETNGDARGPFTTIDTKFECCRDDQSVCCARSWPALTRRHCEAALLTYLAKMNSTCRRRPIVHLSAAHLWIGMRTNMRA
jgi:hypothetical protein